MDRRRRRGAWDGPPQKERSPGQTTEAAEGSVWDEVHLQVLAQCTTVSQSCPTLGARCIEGPCNDRTGGRL